MKLKFDKLREDYSKVSTREKKLTDKNKELIFQSEGLKNELEELKRANHQILNKQIVLENDYMESLKHKNAFEKNFLDFKNEIAYLKEENSQLYKIKEEYERIKYQIPLYSSKEVLNNLETSKQNQEKELEAVKTKNKLLESELILIKNENESLSNENTTSKEALERNIKTFNDVKNELEELKAKNSELEKEKNLVKDNFRNLFSKAYKANKNSGDNSIKITVDEYDEFENLRRERDELDALIMKLKSNGEAKDVLIKSLQLKIENSIKK